MKQCNVLLALLTFSIAFTSCEKIIGKGPVVTDNRTTTTYHDLVLAVPADTYFEQGASYKLEIKAQQNILDEIETVVINDELKVRFRGNNTKIRSHEGITINITAPDARNLRIDGSGNLQVNGPFTPVNMGLKISGSGNIRVQDINTSNLYTLVSGSGNITVSNGIVNEGEYRIEGSGNTDVQNVQAKEVNASISGSGTIRTWATNVLDARISGSGTIYYKGSPQVNTSVSGSGSVRHQ